VFLFLLFQAWAAQDSGTTASLRGVHAVNNQVVWASGARGTVLKTTDGGATWQAATVPGAEALDFRDVHAFDQRIVFLMSIGEGEKSKVFKTTDGGATWALLFTNPDAKGFFDEFAFWDINRGILVGDQVEGRLVVMTTEDGGRAWQRQATPPSPPGEAAFAASGSGIIVRGKREVWIGTGGIGGARVLYSADRGRTWRGSQTPLRNDSASSGIFSLAFADSRRGVAVGGDYTKPADTTGNAAITTDGGRTWARPAGTPPSGFRSAVTYVAPSKLWIAVGTSGSDVSTDGGQSWRLFDGGGYNAVSFTTRGAVWAVGPQGRIARFRSHSTRITAAGSKRTARSAGARLPNNIITTASATAVRKVGTSQGSTPASSASSERPAR
jgi:photosystem II stability/assembly factor-like uncharacterized protein